MADGNRTQRRGTRLSLVVLAIFVMACSCRGCFLSNYTATVVAADGETVLAEGHADNAETAVRFACGRYCDGQEDPAACKERCVAREGPTVTVGWDGKASFWDLLGDIVGTLIRQACRS